MGMFPNMENFLSFYSTGNGVHTIGTHRSSYKWLFSIIGRNHTHIVRGTVCTNLCTPFLLQFGYDFGQLWKIFVTHIWYTPFLLQYGYDFGQLWKIFCPSILRGTVYTHLVHTVPLTIGYKKFSIIGRNHTHIVRGTVCTKCVYTVPRTIEGQKIFHNWPKSYPYCKRNGVYQMCVHRSPYIEGKKFP